MTVTLSFFPCAIIPFVVLIFIHFSEDLIAANTWRMTPRLSRLYYLAIILILGQCNQRTLRFIMIPHIMIQIKLYYLAIISS